MKGVFLKKKKRYAEMLSYLETGTWNISELKIIRRRKQE